MTRWAWAVPPRRPRPPNPQSKGRVDGDRGLRRAVRDEQTQLSDALNALLENDSQWRVVPSPGCVTVTRGWPDGSVDTLIILSPETAYGRRDDARERQVWAVKGTVEQIVAAARDVPPPLAPNAPTDPDSPERTGFWT